MTHICLGLQRSQEHHSGARHCPKRRVFSLCLNVNVILVALSDTAVCPRNAKLYVVLLTARFVLYVWQLDVSSGRRPLPWLEDILQTDDVTFTDCALLHRRRLDDNTPQKNRKRWAEELRKRSGEAVKNSELHGLIDKGLMQVEGLMEVV